MKEKLHIRSLIRTMVAFGFLGVTIAFLVLGLTSTLGWLVTPGNFGRTAGWISAFSSRVLLSKYFLPAVITPAQPVAWQIWVLVCGLALLNFIPYVAIGACFYFGRLGLRRLRSRRTRPESKGEE
jgi:hypothetical protein